MTSIDLQKIHRLAVESPNKKWDASPERIRIHMLEKEQFNPEFASYEWNDLPSTVTTSIWRHLVGDEADHTMELTLTDQAHPELDENIKRYLLPSQENQDV